MFCGVSHDAFLYFFFCTRETKCVVWQSCHLVSLLKVLGETDETCWTMLTVFFRHCMAFLQVGDRGSGLNMWRTAVIILNNCGHLTVFGLPAWEFVRADNLP